jgi:hypothetical protein
MTFFDSFIYLLFFLRFSSIFFGIITSYHKKILSNDETSIEHVKENEYHKEKMIRNGKIKKVLDFLFTILFAFLIFILFRPGDKKGVVLDLKTNILFKIAAITLMINADWDSFYLFIHPLVKNIERTQPL